MCAACAVNFAAADRERLIFIPQHML